MGSAGGTPRRSATKYSKYLAKRVPSSVLIAAVCILFSTLCLGQEEQRVEATTACSSSQTTSAPQTSTDSQQQTAPCQSGGQSGKKKKRESRGAFVIAPLPISSPAIGSGIVPVVGYIFPFSTKDKVSPPSVVGAAGLVTNNGSRGFAVGGKLYLKQDTYRLSAGFAHGNVNYDLFGSGTRFNVTLPLQQTGQMFFGEILRRIGWKFFLGPQFLAGKSFLTVRPNGNNMVPIPPDLGLNTTLTALGVRLTRDTSANRFYPTNGTFFSFTSDFFSQRLGSKYSFQTYRTTFNKYWSLGDKQVLAYNAYFCATGGDPPFYGNCIYGTNNELRGYTAGQYFTRYMVATQVEYRLVLPKRFGLVVFGGIGEAVPGQNQVYGSQSFLPAGGGGLRFQLSKQYHVNLRADIAQGKNGHTFGLGIGEAF
jgi:hypothetical protein